MLLKADFFSGGQACHLCFVQPHPHWPFLPCPKSKGENVLKSAHKAWTVKNALYIYGTSFTLFFKAFTYTKCPVIKCYAYFNKFNNLKYGFIIFYGYAMKGFINTIVSYFHKVTLEEFACQIIAFCDKTFWFYLGEIKHKYVPAK